MATTQTPATPSKTEVGFGDPRVELNTLDRYKGRKGIKDRIALVGRALMRGNSHFAQQKKFRCLTEQVDKPAICCDRLGGPTQYFAIPVFHYVTDQEGNIMVNEKCQGQLKVWLLSETKYKELSTLHKQWPLLDDGWGKTQHDIIITTTEESFQRMSFVPTNSAHWKTKEAWYKTIVQRALNAKERIALALGRKMTPQEVMELLGVVSPAQAAPMATATDIDLADIVSTPAPAAPAPAVPAATVGPVFIPAPQPAPVAPVAAPPQLATDLDDPLA